MLSLPMLLGLGGCGDADHVHDTDAADGVMKWTAADGVMKWTLEGQDWLPAMTLVAREGIAVLEIEDDEVLFEGVPFEGTVPIVTTPTGMRAVDTATMEWTIAGRKVSLVLDNHGTMEVSVGELRFTVTRGGEELEFDGRRARLADGAKRAVFTKDDDIEVSDRE